MRRLTKATTSPITGYRLRVGDFRVLYDVDARERCVTILRVLSKEDALRYLEGSGHENLEN
jgi:mRNA-degrading endonuclease RelE of RelBE toxin-antitoxin system